MTISADDYFAIRQPQRKKEPRLLAIIDRDSCTSCNACAAVCPVDCIYEVVGGEPAHSYHAIDTSRCIGCQLCYRIPSESSDRYALEVCPWNAIDLVNNPTLAEDAQWVLQRYWTAPKEEQPWGRLDELGFQLMLNGELRIPADASQRLAAAELLQRPIWGRGDDVRAIVAAGQRHNGVVRFAATEEGRDLLQVAFRDYANVFLD